MVILEMLRLSEWWVCVGAQDIPLASLGPVQGAQKASLELVQGAQKPWQGA